MRPSAARPAIPGVGPQSVAEVLDRVLAGEPGREALVGRHGRMSDADLDATANRAARALAVAAGALVDAGLIAAEPAGPAAIVPSCARTMPCGSEPATWRYRGSVSNFWGVAPLKPCRYFISFISPPGP